MIIEVSISPNSSRNEIINIDKNKFKIKLKSKREKGNANKELINTLSKYFDISRSLIIIKKGHFSKRKLIEVIKVESSNKKS